MQRATEVRWEAKKLELCHLGGLLASPVTGPATASTPISNEQLVLDGTDVLRNFSCCNLYRKAGCLIFCVTLKRDNNNMHVR